MRIYFANHELKSLPENFIDVNMGILRAICVRNKYEFGLCVIKINIHVEPYHAIKPYPEIIDKAFRTICYMFERLYVENFLMQICYLKKDMAKILLRNMVSALLEFHHQNRTVLHNILGTEIRGLQLSLRESNAETEIFQLFQYYQFILDILFPELILLHEIFASVTLQSAYLHVDTSNIYIRHDIIAKLYYIVSEGNKDNSKDILLGLIDDKLRLYLYTYNQNIKEQWPTIQRVLWDKLEEIVSELSPTIESSRNAKMHPFI